jgi:hypothetical protein
MTCYKILVWLQRTVYRYQVQVRYLYTYNSKTRALHVKARRDTAGRSHEQVRRGPDAPAMFEPHFLGHV